MNNNPLEKSTCNNLPVGLIIPIPVSVVVGITKTSESYVKKIISGNRPADTDKAQKVIKAVSLLKGAMEVAVKEVNQTINQ